MNAYQQVEAIESVLFDLIDPDDDAALATIREHLDEGWGLLDIFQVVADYKDNLLGGTGNGVRDHGLLDGLGDDDHSAIYDNKTHIAATYATKAEVAALDLSGHEAGSVSADNVTETATNKVLTSAERTKLSGIAPSATANSSDATLLNLGNSTGTLDANKITSNAGTGPTDGRKYTKADADAVARIPGSGTVITQTTLDAHKAATTAEHLASAVRADTGAPWGDSSIFGTDVSPAIVGLLNWDAGTSADDILQDLSQAISVLCIQNNIHIADTTNVHGIADGTKVISKDSNGVITLVKATTAPAGNPPSDSVYLWVGASNDLQVKNHNGDQTQVTPGWRNVYVKSTSDVAVTSDVVNFSTIITCPESLVAGAEYLVQCDLYVLAAAATGSGGFSFKWTTLPASASFDWAVMGAAYDAGAGTDREQLTMTLKHGTASSTVSGFGGQGTSARMPIKISGLLKLDVTAGAPILGFHQDTSSATASTVKANSWCRWERVA